MGVDQQNYLFSFEAVLKETDWVLAVAVPLHGEEVMILNSMDKKDSPSATAGSFEARLERELRERLPGNDLKNRSFTHEIRSFIRFILAEKLSVLRSCRQLTSEKFLCFLDDEKFELFLSPQKVRILKELSDEYQFELTAENLKGSFFQRTNFLLNRPMRTAQDRNLMSLELFWK